MNTFYDTVTTHGCPVYAVPRIRCKDLALPPAAHGARGIDARVHGRRVRRIHSAAVSDERTRFYQPCRQLHEFRLQYRYRCDPERSVSVLQGRPHGLAPYLGGDRRYPAWCIYRIFFYSVLPANGGFSTSPDWALGFLFGLGGFAGMYLGARLQKYVPQKFIKLMLGIMIVSVALKYIVQFFKKKTRLACCASLIVRASHPQTVVTSTPCFPALSAYFPTCTSDTSQGCRKGPRGSAEIYTARRV
jgi:hypothetical protein